MASISSQNIAKDLLTITDQVIGHFVQTGYQQLISNNQTTLTLLMTFYIMLLGYKFATRTLEMDITVVAKHLLLLLVVYALLMRWDLFWLFFYNTFTNEPSYIAKTMVNTQGSMKGSSVADALNTVLMQGMQATQTILKQANWRNPLLFAYAFAVFLATCASCIYALFLLIYAKMALAIMLFLAPIFLCFLLWPSTRRLFENWLQALFNFSLIPIVTCGILMLILTILQITLPGLLNDANNGMPHFTGLIAYILCATLGGLLLTQVKATCAGLSSGLSLEGLGNAISVAGNALRYSGASQMAQLAKKVATTATRNANKQASQIKAERAKQR